MSEPRFIVLEGIDGSGTTSQCRALAEGLRKRGHDVLETREPSGGEIGRLTRALLAVGSDRDPVDPAALALLFAADRMHHLETEIRPALEAGRVVLCDRYVVSSWAYQSLECPRAWVEQINAQAMWPDLTFYLHVEAEEAMRRIASRKLQEATPEERYDRLETQSKLAHAYAEIAADPRHRNIVTLDGCMPLEAVTEALFASCASAGL